LSKGEGERGGQTPNPNLFGVHFGSRGGATKSLDKIHNFIFIYFWMSSILTIDYYNKKKAGAELCQAQVKLGLVWLTYKLLLLNQYN
jgi:hypothetical protein